MTHSRWGMRVVVTVGMGLLTTGCDKTRYEVTGTGTATIRYKDSSNKLVTVADAPLPWSKDVWLVADPEVAATGKGPLSCDVRRNNGIDGISDEGQCHFPRQ